MLRSLLRAPCPSQQCLLSIIGNPSRQLQLVNNKLSNFNRVLTTAMDSSHGGNILHGAHDHKSLVTHSRNMSLIRKSSFLSDEEGVNSFIELLGEKEKKLLLTQLMNQQRTPVIEETFDQAVSPSSSQLKLLFAHQLLPFVGFGFLDNLIMILAGEYIDTTLGVTLGISTMAAAGLGNALSDVAGIGSAWYVEQIGTRVGIKYPDLTAHQESMKITKFITQLGRVLGVFLGCLLGMFPLLFIEHKPDGGDNGNSKPKADTPSTSGANDQSTK